ncbi:MAG: biliverdin-producing heme oxygenase [Phycisphaerales bacterium JB043]
MTTLDAPVGIVDQTESLSSELKRSTSELHTLAERSPRMASLVRGQMGRDGYAAHLGQLYLLHEGLERALAEFCASEPRVCRVIDESQFQAPNALEDLAYLGVSLGTFRACGPVERFLSHIESCAQECPWKLLGMHYVLEGSKNGGRFLAKIVRKAYDLPEGMGDRYMDPYGDAQGELWARFKASMDALELASDERQDVLDGAHDIFEMMVELGSL